MAKRYLPQQTTMLLGSLYEKMVEQKRFDLLGLLIDRKEIPTDLYEYDSFQGQCAETVIKRMLLMMSH